MIKVEEFYLSLKKHGIDFATGVPCAAQKRILYHFLTDPEMTYIQAAREEDAIGIATGAFFAGRRPIVLMQNSGLANCINAIASLCIPYKIPVLLLVTWRGYVEDKNEPSYHRIMGKSTIPIMNEMNIPVQVISKENPEIAIFTSIKEMEEKQVPAVMLLIRRGVFE
jgi:sulfopyruvate decarboxylase alpha subunit